MLIDYASGTIVFDDDVEIFPGMGVDQALSHPVLQRVLWAQGSRHVSLGRHAFCDGQWDVSLSFAQSHLSLVSLSHSLPACDSDWTLDNERLRQRLHDETLVKIAKVSRKSVEEFRASLQVRFAWGLVSSDLDLKGVEARVNIAY